MSAWIPLLDSTVSSPPPRDFAGCSPMSGPGDAYDALLKRFNREHVPYSVQWELTHVCNLKCVMCYNEPLAEPELTTAECFDLLGQMADAGTLRLMLTGGEILSRRDFFDIATEARRLGFALDLKTNGALITPAVADRIAALTPLQVDISLLGATDATFDGVTQVRGTRGRVVNGVTLLRERGVRVKLNTLLMKSNIAERKEMLDLAHGLGVEYEQVLKVSPTDQGREKAADEQLGVAEMADALLADGSGFDPFPWSPESRTCSVGLASCLISPYGVVYPCVELRIAAGSVRQQRFADIWRDAPILRDLRDRHTLNYLPECRDCALLKYCEGRCSGLSWKETGDLLRGHTSACRQAQARYTQQHPGGQAPDTPFLARERAMASNTVSITVGG